MSGASSRDDGRNMDRMLKSMSSTSTGDDCRIIFSRFTAMSSASSGVEGSKMLKSQGSSSVEEYDQGGNHNMLRGWRSSSVEEAEKGGEFSLKKGPWTPREDAILIAYVQKHGNGNWNAVERNSGLGRCGKSCRLRWTNHLKPGLKKGPFTKEEEQRIIDLHATMGNKWAQLAAEFPGRTDNEIKNFWNTRLKRKKRTQDNESEISQQQVSNGNGANLNLDAFTNEANQHVSGSQTNFFDIREVEFRKLNRSSLLEDLSVNKPMHVSGKLAHLEQSSNSSQYNMLPMMHPSKRLHRSDMSCSSLNPSAVPVFDQYGNNRSANTSKHPSLLSPCVLKGCNQFGNNLTGSHAAIYGNSSSSSSDHIYGNCKPDLPSIQHFQNEKPICRMPECSLPSLESVNTPESSIQFQTNQSAAVTHQNSDVRQGIWCTNESPLPMLQSVDTPEPNQSVSVSPPNDDGLLDSVLYRFLNSNGSNNVNSFQQNNDSFVANEAIQNSTSNPSEKQCDEQVNLRSSLGPYAASVLADYAVTKTQDDGDKHGTLTESPADYSSQEIQNLLNPVPAPDLSFIDNLYSNGYS